VTREQLAELAVTLRWLQRENALAWREADDNWSAAPMERKGAAIAYGQAALAIERMLQVQEATERMLQGREATEV